MNIRIVGVLLTCMLAAVTPPAVAQGFVSVKGRQLFVDGDPYYFVGTNYWYGGLLAIGSDKERGIQRLRSELDFLKSSGVTNLRLPAGAEGSGPLNGVIRIGPPLQPEQGRFDERVLDGLDTLLAEMGKRDMRAVIFFSNNWEWSGGFQQYLIWNRVVPDKWLQEKPPWDELRDITAKFYSCAECKTAYAKQVNLVLDRTNKVTGKRYIDDPVIMAWELANEPRPMRPAANEDYRTWIADTAAQIKAKDRNHLVTIGHEGWIGTQDIGLFEAVHTDRNIDYLTIHIWPKNWGWFTDLAGEFSNAIRQTKKYVDENAVVAARLNKPLVIEEFGLPRDGGSFDPESTTVLRDRYYATVLSYIKRNKAIAGANFWAFGGTARPIKNQPFWKPGDDYMGDPPMEEQGLNSVFDRDTSTWNVIRKTAKRVGG
jgi:mannan endo-1,4-beta-mannosidase